VKADGEDSMSAKHPRALRVVNDAVPRDLLAELVEFINGNGWHYGWHSSGKKQYCHWNQTWASSKKERRNVEDDLPDVVLRVWKHLKAHHLQGMTLIRAYANAHTYGTDGYPHKDSKDPQDRTIVVYCNPVWNADWGGETVFFGPDGTTVAAVSPKWGRISWFPSDWLHAARTVSRDCIMLRVVAVFKARVPDDPA
jgi:SM-20-related protein